MGNIFEKIKRWWKRVINPKTIEDKLKLEPAISKKMEEHQQVWYDMYVNKQVLDEDGNIIKSLNLPYIISSEKARLATLELKSTVYDPNKKDDVEDVEQEEDNSRANYLNNVYKQFLTDVRHKITPGVALGTQAIKVVPNVQEQTFDFDFVLANEFFPIAFNSANKLTHAVFVEQIVKKDYTFTKLESHELKGGTITVTNEAFKSHGTTTSNELGTKIQLTEIAEWANLEPSITIASTNGVQLDRLLVTMFTMPESNNIDVHSKLGMSCFEPARELINDANKMYSDFLWEFEGGALAINAGRDTIKEFRDSNGNTTTSLPKRAKRLFRTVNTMGAGDSDFFQVFSPAIRDVSYHNGLNTILMKIEDAVTLSRGSLSNVQSEARTATEINFLKQRTYQSNHDLQQRLQSCFEDIVYILDIYTTLYNFAPQGEYKTQFEWDDSILVDIETELKQKVTLISQGAMFPEELMAWYEGVTLEKRFKEVATYIELQKQYIPQEEPEEDDQTNIE